MNPIRLAVGTHILLLSISCSQTSSVSGTAELPDCTEPAAADLTGTWFDEGTVTITSDGCEDQGAAKGEEFASCPLSWVVEQDGNAVSLRVDEEYDVRGRMCGDTLHLEGGWWLPVEDENGQCNYDDDDGDEVGIEREGASVVLSTEDPAEVLTGTLVVRGKCTAEYVVSFRRVQ